MVVAIDVQCGGTAVTTAVVGWRAWTDAAPAWTRVDRHPGAPAPYVDRRRPGRGAPGGGRDGGPVPPADAARARRLARADALTAVAWLALRERAVDDDVAVAVVLVGRLGRRTRVGRERRIAVIATGAGHEGEEQSGEHAADEEHGSMVPTDRLAGNRSRAQPAQRQRAWSSMPAPSTMSRRTRHVAPSFTGVAMPAPPRPVCVARCADVSLGSSLNIRSSM